MLCKDHRRLHTPPREQAKLLGRTPGHKRPPALPCRKPTNWDLKINLMNDTANKALTRPTHPSYLKRTAPQQLLAPVRKPTAQPLPLTNTPKPPPAGHCTEADERWADLMAPVATLERPHNDTLSDDLSISSGSD